MGDFMKKIIFATMLLTLSTSIFSAEAVMNHCFDAGINGMGGDLYKNAKKNCEFMANSMRAMSNEDVIFITKCAWDGADQCKRNGYPGTGSFSHFLLNVKVLLPNQ